MSNLRLDNVERTLRALGFRADAPRGDAWRFDAGETAAFYRQLQFIETQIYETKYPQNRARTYIPVAANVPAGYEFFVWRIWDFAGQAKIVSNAADDLPMANVMAAEKIQRIETIGDAFSYSLQELRSASLLNLPLEAEQGMLARRLVENKIENLSVFGDPITGLPGFINNPNVPVLAAPTTGFGGGWLANPNPSPETILDDLQFWSMQVVVNSLNTHQPNTMLLPLAHYSYIATQRLNTFTDETILRVFLKNSPWIKTVDQWTYLNTAGPGGTPMGIVYDRNPEVVKLVIPQEFEIQPPQPRNLAFVVPCFARYGGVSWRYPVAACYATGI